MSEMILYLAYRSCGNYQEMKSPLYLCGTQELYIAVHDDVREGTPLVYVLTEILTETLHQLVCIVCQRNYVHPEKFLPEIIGFKGVMTADTWI